MINFAVELLANCNCLGGGDCGGGGGGGGGQDRMARERDVSASVVVVDSHCNALDSTRTGAQARARAVSGHVRAGLEKWPKSYATGCFGPYMKGLTDVP